MEKPPPDCAAVPASIPSHLIASSTRFWAALSGTKCKVWFLNLAVISKLDNRLIFAMRVTFANRPQIVQNYFRKSFRKIYLDPSRLRANLALK